MNDNQQMFMREAVRLSQLSLQDGKGGPFGCVIVKDNKIIGRGNNQVTSSNDPTAHAEVMAIRDACRQLGTFQLEGCEVYTSCEPCPMCLGAIYWARPARVYYANTRKDAADIGFDDDFIYKEIEIPVLQRSIPFERMDTKEAKEVFATWQNKKDRIDY
ncbi:MAG: tRNA-specific adenosine deaminase [Azospira oryzae]|jgi:guanine deaminase|nr:tRNA-specific adenosine deaminase [Cytophaga sp.]PZR40260.1 MAG: tRNA-specific adenosine deaminase [Azospira oryzae]